MRQFMADAVQLTVKRDEQKGKIWSYLRSKVGNYAIGSDDIWNLRFPLPPLDIQKQIVTKILAKRAEITILRERATQIRREAEVEAMILGTKPV
jgi:hypothetical protein